MIVPTETGGAGEEVPPPVPGELVVAGGDVVCPVFGETLGETVGEMLGELVAGMLGETVGETVGDWVAGTVGA